MIDLFEVPFIEWIEERYGRLAAWLATIAYIVAVFGIMIGCIIWAFP